MNRKEHWESVYRLKKFSEMSWYQSVPEASLSLIRELGLDRKAKIIDIGGGDSFLADSLLEEGYQDITVLDISETAIGRGKSRLGENPVKWVQCDILDFRPEEKYDLWHDRAAFHFLNRKSQKIRYLEVLKNAVKPGGFSVMATFSEKGPLKCSGIRISRYTKEELATMVSEDFEVLQCKNVLHRTPSGADQDFSFCSFRKK